MKKKVIIIGVLLIVLAGCSGSKKLSQKELSAFDEILNTAVMSDSLSDISEEMLTDGNKEKFPAVKKIYVTEDNKYLFISKPVAYNGPVTLAVVIDGSNNKTVGIRIIKHSETKHYVRDFDGAWFTDRFSSKSVDNYLKLVHLEAKEDDEVIIITGATTTTEGVVNGVNACVGLYNEAVLNKEMPSVNLKAKIIK